MPARFHGPHEMLLKSEDYYDSIHIKFRISLFMPLFLWSDSCKKLNIPEPKYQGGNRIELAG